MTTLGAALPPLLVVTDRTQVPAGRSLVDQVRGCIDGGARAVLLREKDLPRDERRVLAVEITALLDGVGGLLIVASDRYLAADVRAAGCHASAANERYWRGRDPSAHVPPSRTERRRLIKLTRRFSCLWGLSCHTSAFVDEAVDAQADYVTLSPVFPSASKPGYGPTLGPDGLGAMVESLRGWYDPEEESDRLRLYALGGIDTPERAAECFAAGADGVAVMGALMRADDPAAATAAMLAAVPVKAAR